MASAVLPMLAAVVALQPQGTGRGGVRGPDWTLGQVFDLAARGRAEHERLQAAVILQVLRPHQPTIAFEGTVWLDRGNPDPANGRPARLAWEVADRYGYTLRQWVDTDRRLKVDDRDLWFEEVTPLESPGSWNEAALVFLGLDPRLQAHFHFQIQRVAGTWPYQGADANGPVVCEQTYEDTQIELTPTSVGARARFQSVTLTLDGTYWLVSELRILDVGNREVVVTISEPRELEDAAKLVPPPVEELREQGYRPR